LWGRRLRYVGQSDSALGSSYFVRVTFERRPQFAGDQGFRLPSLVLSSPSLLAVGTGHSSS